MNTDRKTALKNGTAKAASLILGDAHFLFKSLADGCVLLEANIVHKLTDKPKASIIEDRHNRTEAVQQEIKDNVQQMFKAFRQHVNNTEHSDIMDNVTGMQ